MFSEHDRTLTTVIQTLHGWCVSMGAIAWVMLGVLLVFSILTTLLLLRWIWSGGLSRQSSFGYFQHRRAGDESVLIDS